MLKLLLKILSGFYYLVTSVRNFLYDNKVIKSHEFFAPVISVGNLTVGGTGKTPHTEYIVNLLKDEFTVTVLSRGYKRETSGYIEADKDSSVAEIGDEPKQMMKKFSGKAFVAVCEDRVKGILNILKKKLDAQIIVWTMRISTERLRRRSTFCSWTTTVPFTKTIFCLTDGSGNPQKALQGRT